MISAITIGVTSYVGFVNVINMLGTLYTLIIFVWALFSWIKVKKGLLKDIYKVLDKLVGPFVGLFRKFLPAMGGIDFSPLVAIIVVQIVVRLLLQVFQFLFTPF